MSGNALGWLATSRNRGNPVVGSHKGGHIMLYEIASIENGEIARGGIKADIRTVGRWIERSKITMPDVLFFAVPASEDAITVAEYKAECKMFATANPA